jgi:hypothetical protein
MSPCSPGLRQDTVLGGLRPQGPTASFPPSTASLRSLDGGKTRPPGRPPFLEAAWRVGGRRPAERPGLGGAGRGRARPAARPGAAVEPAS